jgi:hypothetical protein
MKPSLIRKAADVFVGLVAEATPEAWPRWVMYVIKKLKAECNAATWHSFILTLEYELDDLRKTTK